MPLGKKHSLTILRSAVSPMGYTEWDGKIEEKRWGKKTKKGVGKDYKKSLSVEFSSTDLPGNCAWGIAPAQPWLNQDAHGI